MSTSRGRGRFTILAAYISITVVSSLKASITQDPAGDTAQARCDLLSVEVKPGASGVDFLLTVAEPYDFPNTQLLFDTDKNATTGFAETAGGFDLLIEGANVFKFQGNDQTAWNWKSAGTVDRSVNGSKLLVAVPRNILCSEFSFFARTLTDAYAQVDRLPDSAVITVSWDRAQADRKSPADDAAEKTGDAQDPSRDITRFAVTQIGPDIRVEVETEQVGDFATLLVFFDTDQKADTGYKSGAAAELGCDALLSGGRIHRFNGNNQTAWMWEGLSDATLSLDGRRYRADFNAADLKSKHAKVVAMMMSADWQTVVDLAPDSGPLQLEIDASKLVESLKLRWPPRGRIVTCLPANALNWPRASIVIMAAARLPNYHISTSSLHTLPK